MQRRPLQQRKKDVVAQRVFHPLRQKMRRLLLCNIRVSLLHLSSFNYLTLFFFTSTTTSWTTVARGSFICSYRYIFRDTYVLNILHPYAYADAKPRVETNVDSCTATDDDTYVNVNIDSQYLSDVPEIKGTSWLHANIEPNTTRITILCWWLIVATTEYGSGGYTMVNEDDATLNDGRRR